MAAKLVEKLRIIVFPILGVVLILCSDHVTRILPYLLGGAMALTAVLRGINDYKTRKLVQDHSDELTKDFDVLTREEQQQLSQFLEKLLDSWSAPRENEP